MILGANISTFPTVLTNTLSTVIYVASTVAVVDGFNYSMTCGGVIETGEVIVVVSSAAVADSTNVLTGTALSALSAFSLSLPFLSPCSPLSAVSLSLLPPLSALSICSPSLLFLIFLLL